MIIRLELVVLRLPILMIISDRVGSFGYHIAFKMLALQTVVVSPSPVPQHSSPACRKNKKIGNMSLKKSPKVGDNANMWL